MLMRKVLRKMAIFVRARRKREHKAMRRLSISVMTSFIDLLKKSPPDYDQGSLSLDDCLDGDEGYVIFERTLKDDAKPFTVVGFTYEVNAKDNTAGFELTYELVEEELTVEVKMEVDSQAETPEITEPADYRSIVDFMRDRINKSNARRETDISLIKAYFHTYVAENGQFPAETGSIFYGNWETEELELNEYSFWDIEYYTSDGLAELLENETAEEDEDPVFYGEEEDYYEDYYPFTYTFSGILDELAQYPQVLILAEYECSDSSPKDGYDNYEDFSKRLRRY